MIKRYIIFLIYISVLVLVILVPLEMFHWKLSKKISSFGAYLILFQLTFIIFQLKCFYAFTFISNNPVNETPVRSTFACK